MMKETITNYLLDSPYLSTYMESIRAMFFYSIGCVSLYLWSYMITVSIGIFV